MKKVNSLTYLAKEWKIVVKNIINNIIKKEEYSFKLYKTKR